MDVQQRGVFVLVSTITSRIRLRAERRTCGQVTFANRAQGDNAPKVDLRTQHAAIVDHARWIHCRSPSLLSLRGRVPRTMASAVLPVGGWWLASLPGTVADPRYRYVANLLRRLLFNPYAVIRP